MKKLIALLSVTVFLVSCSTPGTITSTMKSREAAAKTAPVPEKKTNQ